MQAVNDALNDAFGQRQISPIYGQNPAFRVFEFGGDFQVQNYTTYYLSNLTATHGKLRGKSGMTLRWEDAFLAGLVASALLRYLAIAHYGRGRGDWSETEYPPFWPPLVAAIVDERRDRLVRLWAQREPACDVERMASGLRDLLADAAREALDRLYPGALGDQRDGASTQTR